MGDSRLAGTHEWLTPRDLLDALGPFDLDPCAPPPERRPWPTAARHYDERDDGLAQQWHGFVWCNPPYGPHVARWLARCAEHGRALALVNARTDTAWFHEHVTSRATAALFLRRRVRFCAAVTGQPAAHPAAPSMLVAYGLDALARLRRVESRGALWVMR